MGLLVQMTVNDRFRVGDLATNVGREVRVRVQVSAPSWISATRVELFANGASIRTNEISQRDARGSGVKAVVEWKIARPAHDVHLIAIATGPGVSASFWATPRPYQPTSPVWTNRVIAATNPIWLDADGDEKFTSARAYARRIVERMGTEPNRVVSGLANFDEAVAAQAASLCSAAGVKFDSAGVANALRAAQSQVERGFAAYARERW
jgi:hypothetical protein